MKSKKFVLAGLVLLAITGLLALTSCKNDSVPPEAHTHTFGDWEVQTPSTDIAAGKLVKKCTTCSEPGGDKMEIPAGFVYIPAGTFQMGSAAGYGYPVEKPVHDVTISKGYFMGRHEVTQQLYFAVMGKNPSNFKTGTENKEPKEGGLPVEMVSWYDAVVYCNRRSIAEHLTPCYAIGGKTNPDEWGAVPTSSNDDWNAITCNWNANGYRLPTEAEWELAARGGNAGADEWKYTYAGSDTVDDVAWHSGNSGSKTHQVGTKAANSLNLHDMSGSVWEWCWDWWASSITAETPPSGGSSGNDRVPRGGGWYHYAGNCAVSSRNLGSPNGRSYYLGFRVVRPSSK